MKSRYSALALTLVLGIVIGAVAATISFGTLHPQYGESERVTLEKRTEALARLADALSGYGTNAVRANGVP